MSTIMSHAVVPLAAAVAMGPGRISPKVAIAGAALAMLPDGDVLGFRFGIDYAADWGHRGATHSLVFAGLVTAALALVWREARSTLAALFLYLSAASHGLFDMLTDGGLGVALYWPFETTRHFAVFTPIRVSPIGANFFSARGWETMLSELRWVWLPALVIAQAGWFARRIRQSPG
ncbi:MAG: metal-dependent hydrolase [Sphingomonadaceae bacterium]|nr:metal-dependent hydrolase [Sphingomonadaceae bacterium]